ncbi:MAG: peptide-binding protein, partial [Epsilonproteobacteria bacterium]|nr:peptide-binding protein [Campylobacterota bacterium]
MAQNDKRLLFLYIAITYIFAIAIRYYWIDWARGFEEFLYNNQVMINTNDGYFFLTGAKNLIFGGYEYNLRVPGLERGLIAITVILAKITPFSLDTLALYMPGFI